MSKFYKIPAVLPVGPTKRLLRDGRVASVLPIFRHTIPMPEFEFVADDWRGLVGAKWHIELWGHPEIALLLMRVESLAQAIWEDRDDTIPALPREVFLIDVLRLNLEAVVKPVANIIAAECDPAFLLEIDGRDRTFSDCVREFRKPDLEAAQNAVRFYHTAAGWLDLLEARLERRAAALIGGRDDG